MDPQSWKDFLEGHHRLADVAANIEGKVAPLGWITFRKSRYGSIPSKLFERRM